MKFLDVQNTQKILFNGLVRAAVCRGKIEPGFKERIG